MVDLGTIIYIAVKPIFKIYMIIGVGIMLARMNILSVDTSKNISSMAILVLLPCLAFNKIVSNIDDSDIKEISTIVIVSCFMIGSGAIGTFLIGVALDAPREWYGGLLSCGLLPNISDLPIAYLQSMEDSSVLKNVDKGVSYVCIFMALQMLVQFNFGGFKLIELDFKKQLEAEKEELSDEEASIAMEEIVGEGTSAHTNDATSMVSSLDSLIDDTSLSALPSKPQKLMPASSKLGSSNGLTRKASITDSLLSTDNDLRGRPAENMDDIVRVYSRFNELKKKRLEDKKATAAAAAAGNSSSFSYSSSSSLSLGEKMKMTYLDRKKYELKQVWKFIKKTPTLMAHLNFRKLTKDAFTVLITSTLKPCSITIIISITVAMIPWVKALFVETSEVQLPSAPDFEPPLSFIMDFASYIGAAQVPIGLLMLGGTIGRLSLKKLPMGVWKTPVGITLFKLFIFPVMGCALNAKLYRDGLFYGEDILYFISNINFCLPPATSLIYITAFYTPVNCKSTLQMDCLALTYIFHYICLVFCLPFVTTYTMKVSLGY
ncbi:DEKNAAC101042 [Brettanomyces naardenensis]|uniref:DEKNAAC101042 n=1 Tax=Brettanomyces naardenensis TaxID=13370 RepID=A0A448YH03_BRENA|nr:DEKNAAC101042 [Brettanomyces naardenensis]